ETSRITHSRFQTRGPWFSMKATEQVRNFVTQFRGTIMRHSIPVKTMLKHPLAVAIVATFAGANLFFQLISRRYEKGPLILTSNQSFGSWGEVFGDRVIATAILDRVLHHAITINIRGNSYRLKDKLKAGLVRTEEPAVVTN